MLMAQRFHDTSVNRKIYVVINHNRTKIKIYKKQRKIRNGEIEHNARKEQVLVVCGLCQDLNRGDYLRRNTISRICRMMYAHRNACLMAVWFDGWVYDTSTVKSHSFHRK